MRLKLEVSLDDAWAHEQLTTTVPVRTLLRTIIDHCGMDRMGLNKSAIIDPNGNTIGRVEVVEE